jgi:hypothetical protein
MKFFTLPPKEIGYPFVIVNARNPNYSYFKKNKDNVEEVIIDSGIEIFRDPNVKDYPDGWVWKLIEVYRKVEKIIPRARIWLVCPDYCDDYNPKALWVDEKTTNIERTVENVKKYALRFNKINWLISIQGHNKDPNSVKTCLNYYKDLGILEKFEYFAIGNLCVEKNSDTIYKTVKIVRKMLGNDKRIHVFGLKLNCVKDVQNLIDSFDTMAWTRPVSRKLGSWSCKTKDERLKFFETWLKTFKKKLNPPLKRYLLVSE